jgi:hypothetical protein
MKQARDSGLNPALALALCIAAGAAFAWLRVPPRVPCKSGLESNNPL